MSFDDLKGMGLCAEDFSSETHHLIFEGMGRLHEKREPIDVLNLCNELDGTSRPNGRAWSSYITNVLGVALQIGDITYHVKKIQEASRLRKLSEAGYRLYEAAQKGDAESVHSWRKKITEFKTPQEKDTEDKCIALAHHDPRPKPWIIKDLIPDGFPSMIYGAGGMGKSFLAAYLGIEACRGGQSFMGHRFPEEPLNSLIIDYELDVDVQTERVSKIASGLNLDGIPDNLYYYTPTKAATQALPEFRGLIKQHNIRFVIIDSWGGSGVDGGNPEDTTAFLTDLRNLKIATLILDHQAKTQTGESYDNKTAFGSVYKYNMCRSVFQLSKIGESQNPMTLRLRHKKSNFGPEVDDLVFDVRFEGDRVLFTESSMQTPEERDLERICKAIATLEVEGERVNQKKLAECLEGVIGQKRLRHLLEKGDDVLWQTLPGERNEKIYKLRTAEQQSNNKCYSEILKNSAKIENYELPRC